MLEFLVPDTQEFDWEKNFSRFARKWRGLSLWVVRGRGTSKISANRARGAVLRVAKSHKYTENGRKYPLLLFK
jgi:hypothetical protein